MATTVIGLPAGGSETKMCQKPQSIPVQAALQCGRALAGALTTGGTWSAPSADPAVDKPLLDLEETAGLLGVSRMTVARMADEGGCHRWVIRRGGCRKYAGSHGLSWTG